MATIVRAFISATSADLRTCRQQVKNCLLDKQWLPVVQDHFDPNHDTVSAMLQKRIAECDAVIHLVGECYGAEPTSPPKGAPRRSYTQLEIAIARQLRKRVFVFLLDERFPYDTHDKEPEELRALQQAYRRQVASGDHLYVPCQTTDDLSGQILKLRIEISKLRKGILALLALLLAIAVLTTYYSWHTRQAAESANQAVQSIQSDVRAMLTQIAKQTTFVKSEESADSNQKQIERSLDRLAAEHEIDPAKLKSNLNAFIAETDANCDSSLRDQALAAFGAGDFVKAQQLALEAAQNALKASNADDSKRILARDMDILAATVASKDNRYTDTERFYKLALEQTKVDIEPTPYAQIQWVLSVISWRIAYDAGDFAKADEIIENVVRSVTDVRGTDDEKRFVESTTYRAAMETAGKLDLWMVAEKYGRMALGTIKPESDPATYASVAMDLITSLECQDRYQDAVDAAIRAKKAIGEEQFNRLQLVAYYFRGRLADQLLWSHRYAECEATIRENIAYLEKEFPMLSSQIVESYSLLAVVLDKQGKTTEAVGVRHKVDETIALARSQFGNDSEMVQGYNKAVEWAKEKDEAESKILAGINFTKQLAEMDKQTADLQKQLDKTNNHLAEGQQEAAEQGRQAAYEEEYTKRLQTLLNLTKVFNSSSNENSDRYRPPFRIITWILTGLSAFLALWSLYAALRLRGQTGFYLQDLKNSWVFRFRKSITRMALLCGIAAIAGWTGKDWLASKASGELSAWNQLEIESRSIVSFTETTFGADSNYHLDQLGYLAGYLREDPQSRHLGEAESTYKHVIAARQKDSSFKSVELATMMKDLAVTLEEDKKNDEALDWYRQALQLKAAGPATTKPKSSG